MKRTYSYAKTDARCPFCHAVGCKSLYEVTSEAAALHFVAPWRYPQRNQELRSIIERLWGQRTCRVVECDSCSGGFAWPFVGGDAAFYETANAEQHEGAYPASRWEFAESTRFLSNPAGACTLEIGAGDGAFVKQLLQAGVPSSFITALEYSPYGMDVIRSRYPGVNVFHGDELKKLPDGKFTHAFLFQVLEHLGDVDSQIQNLCRLLKPGGMAFISVPHPTRTKLHELSGLTLDMPPNHISRYSQPAFAALAARNGLQLQTMVDQPFSWKQAFPEFLLFHFTRLSQKEGSIADRIHSRLTGKRHKYAAGLLAIALVPHAILSLAMSEKSGGNRLFVVRKP